MGIMGTPVKLDALIDALDWVSAAGAFENEAYVHRESGQIFWSSATDEFDEELPEDVGDDSLYVAVPHKHDLDLGRGLALRFVQERLPGSLELADEYFRHKGAYARFKGLLERSGQLDAWYQYEAKAMEQGLREWAGDNGLEVASP